MGMVAPAGGLISSNRSEMVGVHVGGKRGRTMGVFVGGTVGGIWGGNEGRVVGKFVGAEGGGIAGGDLGGDLGADEGGSNSKSDQPARLSSWLHWSVCYSQVLCCLVDRNHSALLWTMTNLARCCTQPHAHYHTSVHRTSCRAPKV